MTKFEMMEIASKAHEDAGLESLEDLFDSEGDPVKTNKGPLLGRFIIEELHETYDANASDSDQRNEARRVMLAAAEDLVGIAEAF